MSRSEFLDIFDIFKCEIPKISTFKACKIVTMTVFDPLKLAKIVNKIRVARKWLNFYIVEYLQSKNPTRLQRSVYPKNCSFFYVESAKIIFSKKKCLDLGHCKM